MGFRVTPIEATGAVAAISWIVQTIINPRIRGPQEKRERVGQRSVDATERVLEIVARARATARPAHAPDEAIVDTMVVELEQQIPRIGQAEVRDRLRSAANVLTYMDLLASLYKSDPMSENIEKYFVFYSATEEMRAVVGALLREEDISSVELTARFSKYAGVANHIEDQAVDKYLTEADE